VSSAPHQLNSTPSLPSRCALRIGGFSLGWWPEKGINFALDPDHHSFLLDQETPKACDIELEIYWADRLQLPQTAPDFESGGLWSAFCDSTGTKFYFSSPTLPGNPYRAAWLDETFSRGHVLLNRASYSADQAHFPLEYPTDELLLMHRLALGEGVELHALGLVDDDGSGYLFLGHSGAGKSTTARLWMRHPGVRLLSDDRIIVRRHQREFRMYGTPWHGDAGVASADSAPLAAIFLLEQAPRHQILPISQPQAAAELFARAFLPHYQKSGIAFTLRFLDELTHSIPSSIFRFAPTDDAVEAIRNVYA